MMMNPSILLISTGRSFANHVSKPVRRLLEMHVTEVGKGILGPSFVLYTFCGCPTISWVLSGFAFQAFPTVVLYHVDIG